MTLGHFWCQFGGPGAPFGGLGATFGLPVGDLDPGRGPEAEKGLKTQFVVPSGPPLWVPFLALVRVFSGSVATFFLKADSEGRRTSILEVLGMVWGVFFHGFRDNVGFTGRKQKQRF